MEDRDREGRTERMEERGEEREMTEGRRRECGREGWSGRRGGGEGDGKEVREGDEGGKEEV